jgi:hypothetical protein
VISGKGLPLAITVFIKMEHIKQIANGGAVDRHIGIIRMLNGIG